MDRHTHCIRRTATGKEAVNTYLLWHTETRRALIIDPGCEAPCPRLIHEVESNGLIPAAVLNTHGHHDHVRGNGFLYERYSIPAYLHPADKAFFLANGLPELKHTYEKALDISHNEILNLADLKIQVRHTPGHTPGSVCFYIEDQLPPLLFTGDTLFVGDAGRTDFPGGSLDTLLASIETQIMPLPGDTRILPGHDYGDSPESTLAREIRENIYITDFLL